MNPTFIRTGLNTLYYSGAHRLFGSSWAGMGAIFMLHHIKPGGGVPDTGFHPNGVLEISPEFLDKSLTFLRAAGFEFVSLADAVDRIRAGESDRRFVCFTIDDGYRDNLEHGLPVFERHDCPFTVFVTTGIVEATTELWWLALEEMIRENDAFSIDIAGETRDFDTSDIELKHQAYAAVYWPFRNMPEKPQRELIRRLCDRYDVDLETMCRREAMTWEEVRTLDAAPLATIGAHTLDHFAVRKLDEEDALREMTESRRRIGEETGRVPEFFCYPYGDPGSAGPREFGLAARAGFAASVTTRKGMVFPEHAWHLQALPRVSLNGDYQALRYIDVFMSGAPFALLNRFRRVNAA